nr:MAG TPA: hypothetical protein [Caudoviricetes sp.]
MYIKHNFKKEKCLTLRLFLRNGTKCGIIKNK